MQISSTMQNFFKNFSKIRYMLQNINEQKYKSEIIIVASLEQHRNCFAYKDNNTQSLSFGGNSNQCKSKIHQNQSNNGEFFSKYLRDTVVCKLCNQDLDLEIFTWLSESCLQLLVAQSQPFKTSFCCYFYADLFFVVLDIVANFLKIQMSKLEEPFFEMYIIKWGLKKLKFTMGT